MNVNHISMCKQPTFRKMAAELFDVHDQLDLCQPKRSNDRQEFTLCTCGAIFLYHPLGNGVAKKINRGDDVVMHDSDIQHLIWSYDRATIERAKSLYRIIDVDTSEDREADI